MRRFFASIGVRDEGAPTFGRQNLTLWSPPFASTFEGWAHELPKRNGFMVKMDMDGLKIRVTCEAPRNDDNYQRVDDAIRAAIKDATKRACQHCGNDIWESWRTPESLMGWAETTWGDDRDFQCGLAEHGSHFPEEA